MFFTFTASTRHSQVVWQAKLKRHQWVNVLCKHLEPGAEVAMEACAGAHHWARVLRNLGYPVKLIAAQFVKPYVKSNKNDRADAEAICEAMSRPSMRFVAPKSVAQQDSQAMHRIRSELVGQRPAQLANTLRCDYRVFTHQPPDLVGLGRALPDWLEDAQNKLSKPFRELLASLRDDLQRLDERVEVLNASIEQMVKSNPMAQRLLTLRSRGAAHRKRVSQCPRRRPSLRQGARFCRIARSDAAPTQHWWQRATVGDQQTR